MLHSEVPQLTIRLTQPRNQEIKFLEIVYQCLDNKIPDTKEQCEVLKGVLAKANDIPLTGISKLGIMG